MHTANLKSYLNVALENLMALQRQLILGIDIRYGSSAFLYGS